MIMSNEKHHLIEELPDLMIYAIMPLIGLPDYSLIDGKNFMSGGSFSNLFGYKNIFYKTKQSCLSEKGIA